MRKSLNCLKYSRLVASIFQSRVISTVSQNYEEIAPSQLQQTPQTCLLCTYYYKATSSYAFIMQLAII